VGKLEPGIEAGALGRPTCAADAEDGQNATVHLLRRLHVRSRGPIKSQEMHLDGLLVLKFSSFWLPDRNQSGQRSELSKPLDREGLLLGQGKPRVWLRYQDMLCDEPSRQAVRSLSVLL
jgi:hypothetical protein